MRWTAHVAAVVTSIGIAAVPAQAIDVQGTWAASLKCTSYPADAPAAREIEDFPVVISQSGESIVVDFPGLFLVMAGLATDDGSDPEPAKKGVIGAGTCADAPFLGSLFGKVRVHTDGRGSLQGKFTGAAFTGPVTCTVNAIRTGTIIPGTPVPCQ
jgi:hypothetical protein